MGKKELIATLGTVLIGTGLTVMLTNGICGAYFYTGIVIIVAGTLLTFPTFLEKSTIQKFNTWKKLKIEQGEDLLKKHNSSFSLSDLERYATQYSIWHKQIYLVFQECVKIQNINKQRLGMFFNELPLSNGLPQNDLKKEIDQLKELSDTLKQSHFEKDFHHSIFKENEEFDTTFKQGT